jgi:predicted dehydrogenase
MPSSRLRVAVVGLAGIGRVHVRLLSSREDAELVGVCDLSPAALEAAETTAPRFGDYARLLEEARPEAVLLATPPAAHLSLTRQAAERGIHVFAEKPMAETVASAQGMIDACAAAGVTLMIGHKKRYVPALARLKSLLEGELGPARFVIHRYAHPGRSEKDWFWREADGGGPLRENAVHAADLLRWLCGEVERVEGEGDFLTFEDRAPQLNCAVLTLRFRSGAIGTLAAGMVGSPPFLEEDFWVATEAGVAEVRGPFDNPNSLRWCLRSDRKERVESFEGDPFSLELDEFLDCVRTGRTPLTNGQEGMGSLELCERWKTAARPPRGA